MRKMQRNPIDNVFDQMQNMLEEFHGAGKELTNLGGGVPVDVREEDDSIVVSADIPGVSKEDISLKADDEGLEISAEAETEIEEENEKYYRKERTSRRFRRKVAWPSAVDPESIEASYDEGVLTVTAEKEEDSGHDIEIE